MKAYKKYPDEAFRLYYPEKAAWYIRETESLFDQIRKDLHFAHYSINPLDGRLFISGYFLAVVQLLDRVGKSMEEIRKMVIGIASSTAFPNMPPCSGS